MRNRKQEKAVDVVIKNKTKTQSKNQKTNSGKNTVSWEKVTYQKLVLISGKEEFIVERAHSRIKELARKQDPNTEITRIDANNYDSGLLAQITSPSLFGEARLVVCDHCEQLNESFLADAIEQIKNGMDDHTHLVFIHRGGVKGKKILDFLRSPEVNALEVSCPEIKYDNQKADIITADIKRAKRHMEQDALRLLISSVGNNIRELSSAVYQLISDVEGTITIQDVKKYYGKTLQITAFEVADLIISGNLGAGLIAYRHALNTGIDPVALLASLTYKVRQILKVSACSRGILTPAEAGMNSWQLEKAKKELRGWNERGLAVAIEAIAQADWEAKGGMRYPEFAVERALRRVVFARNVG